MDAIQILYLYPDSWFKCTLTEAVQAMYGNSYGSKLKPIAGTHDQLQVEGFVSSEAYSTGKLRVVSLNKNILRTNRFYQVIERELKKSLIKIPDDQNQKKATPGLLITIIDNFANTVLPQ